MKYVILRPSTLFALFLACLLFSTVWPLAAAFSADPVVGHVAQGSVSIPQEALSPVPYNSRFGLAWVSSAEMGDVPESRYQKARDTGSRWNRWVMYWVDRENSQRSMDWSTWDTNVIRDHSQGFNVLALLQQTPDWAVTSSGMTNFEILSLYQRPGSKLDSSTSSQDVITLDTRPPRNLDKPVFLPDGSINRDNYWGYFVWRTVNRYKPGGELAKQEGWTDGWGVRHWEIWNEPNFPSYWRGTVAQYYLLLKVAYQAAKAADPGAFVVWGGIAHAGNSVDWARGLMDEMVRDGKRTSGWPYFDASNFHWYDEPGVLYSLSSQMRSDLNSRGLGGKPMWITETNVRTYGDPGAPLHPACGGYDKSASPDEQASFAIQAFANAFAAGVEKVYVHQLQDDQYGQPDAEAWGLVRNDGSLRPMYAAYQVAAKYFANPQQVTRYVQDGGKVVRVVLGGVRLDGKFYRVTVLWNTSGGQVLAKVPAVSASAQRLRKNGVFLAPVAASGGYFDVWLDAARLTCPEDGKPFYVGGDPRILLEESNITDTTPPTASVTKLPERVQPSFTVSWSGSDEAGGSGIRSYDVQYRDVTIATGWQNWKTTTAATSAVFQGSLNHTYQFRSRATDVAGNTGTFPSAPQAQTTVVDDVTAPTASISPLPPMVEPWFTLSWSGTDGVGGSGIRDYDVQYRDVTFDTNAVWQDWRVHTPATSATIAGQSGHTYQFRCRATDNAGNVGVFSDKDEDHRETTVKYVAQQTGLVVNGGFEDTGDESIPTPIGWSLEGSIKPKVATLGHSGTYSVSLGYLQPQMSGESSIYQPIEVPEDVQEARLSFWYLRSPTQSTDASRFEIEVRYSDQKILLVPPVCVGAGWCRGEVDLAKAGSQQVDLRGLAVDIYFRAVVAEGSPGFGVYLDDVEMWPFNVRMPLVWWSPGQ